MTPTRVGQSYTYSPGQHNQQDLYDVPPSRSQGVGVSCSHSMYMHVYHYDLFKKKKKKISFQNKIVLRDHHMMIIFGVHHVCFMFQVYDIPPGQMFPGQHSAARNQGVYDVPPAQVDPRTQGIYDVPPSSQGVRKLIFHHSERAYQSDTPFISVE